MDRMDTENSTKLFCIVAHFQLKEFVGQKAVNQETQEEISGNTPEEVLDNIWLKVSPIIKREIVINDDNITWAENETPIQDEMGKFIVFQDKSAKKTYLVSQIDSDALRKMRNKHVNVMVHTYGRSVSSKSVHQKVTAMLLQPANRDRAGAHSTVSLLDLVRQLKERHGSYLSANTSSWTMWANAIHSGPIHKQESMIDDLPPAHIIHLFRSVPTAETEVMRSVQNGLQVAGNLNDLYCENLGSLRDEFLKAKEIASRAFDLFEVRLQAAEDMLRANSRIVSTLDSALHVDVNPVSLFEEQQVLENDMLDVDHE